MDDYMCIVVAFCVAASLFLSYWTHPRREGRNGVLGWSKMWMPHESGRVDDIVSPDVVSCATRASLVPTEGHAVTGQTRRTKEILLLFLSCSARGRPSQEVGGRNQSMNLTTARCMEHCLTNMEFIVASNGEEVSVSQREQWWGVDTQVHQRGEFASKVDSRTEEAGLCLRVFTHLESLFNHQRSKHADTSLGVRLRKVANMGQAEVDYSRKNMLYGRPQWVQVPMLPNEGAPLGSPLSPALAELLMEHLEEIAFEGSDNHCTPRLFKRYVDDIFAIVKKGQEEALLKHLNSIFPRKVSCTIEREIGRKLPLLDVLVPRNATSLKRTVYRKTTHSDRYLHFSSHHSMSVKRGIVTGLVDRAIAICDPEFLNPDLLHIPMTLEKNGYPKTIFCSTITRRLNPKESSSTTERDRLPVLTISY
ncbi:hypothetical protein TTRE_0000842901 [Trichuris trichiura]|uniref:Helix-turn-helix domain-containing protein n=1 Tax=Trichuris trichiura TaxID=36087 RepID=A0A077ZK52_TRITR|nr:hypothetical protein TTRE_0000842901 [Trichuris trichiura]